MSVMICFFFSSLVVVKGIAISTKNVFSLLVEAGIIYECSQTYCAYPEGIKYYCKLFKTITNVVA